MDIYSTFKVKLSGSNEDITEISELLEQETDGNIVDDGLIEVEESYSYATLQDIEDLAVEIVETSQSINFVIDGTVDSEGNEFMDYRIVYQNGKLTSESSCWYIRCDTEDFDNDYSVFKDEFENNQHLSKKVFNQAVETGVFYILDEGEGDMVVKVPLLEPEEISID